MLDKIQAFHFKGGQGASGRVTLIITGGLRLCNFINASTELMQVMARACGRDHLNKFNREDLATWKKEMADLSGIAYSGIP